MQVCDEAAIGYVKQHSRISLLRANAPTRWWPDATTDFVIKKNFLWYSQEANGKFSGRCWFCHPARFDVLGLLVHLDFLLANLSSKDFEVKSRSYLCDSWPRCGRLVDLIVPVQHLKKALLLYPGPTAWSTILQDDSRQDRPPSRLLYSSFDVPWQA